MQIKNFFGWCHTVTQRYKIDKNDTRKQGNRTQGSADEMAVGELILLQITNNSNNNATNRYDR